MASLNKVMLIGRLTDNPEPPRVIPSGAKVIKFRFAVGRSKKNPQTGQWENDPNPLYIDCEAWNRGETGKTADLIEQYLRKGSMIFVEGRLQLDTWDDKTTGQKRSKHKIVVERFEFLDTKQDSAGGEGMPVRNSAPARGPAPQRTAPAQGSYYEDAAGDSGPADEGGGGDIPF